MPASPPTDLLVDAPPPDRRHAEALIGEARRRTRRRRRRAVLAALALAVAAVGGGFALAGGGARSAQAGVAGLPRVDVDAFAGHGVLAFVSRGRLFVLDGTTRSLTAITRGAQTASAPQLSPNGRWLIYAVATPATSGERLVRSDGRGARPIGQGARWLPDGALAFAGGLYRITARGRLQRIGDAPSELGASSPDADRFAFWVGTVAAGRDGRWRERWRLQVADTLRGRRTTWLSTLVSFDPRSGVHGEVPDGIVVLPHREGILLWFDPDNADDADGRPLYEITRPGGPATLLAVTVGSEVSPGPDGTLAIGAGGNRYAWRTKTVETCTVASATCVPVPAASGELSFDPAWAPDGRALAFVEAPPSTHADFYQSTVTSWYAEHRLWLLRTGSRHPVEIPGTAGAATPTWSGDSRSLLYVADDALWLIPALGARPAEVAAPLFVPSDWPSYYGQIAWTAQFSWASP